jgi:hypothetical protein
MNFTLFYSDIIIYYRVVYHDCSITSMDRIGEHYRVEGCRWIEKKK